MQTMMKKRSAVDMVPHPHVEENKKKKIKRFQIPCKLSKLMELLPHEVLVQIVTKLPASIILPCSNLPPKFSVNNTTEFNNIISDPSFPTLFQSNCKSSSNTTFLAFDHTRTYLIDYNHEDDHLSEFCIDMDVMLGTRSFRVLASCNGWLLVSLKFPCLDGCPPKNLCMCTSSLRLVNPITRQCAVLPDAPSLQYPPRSRISYGLGYSASGQFKVVRLFIHEQYPEYSAEVYTVGAGVDGWEITDGKSRGPNFTKEVLRKLYTNVIPYRAGATPLNGALHWLVKWRDHVDYTSNLHDFILKYDLDDNKFEYFRTPSIASGIINAYVGVLDGMLCVYASLVGTSLQIWVMKEYGVDKTWTCSTIIDSIDIWNPFPLIPVLKNGKLLMLYYDDDDDGKIIYADAIFCRERRRDRNFYVDVYDPRERRRDRSVSLLEGLDGNLRNEMTIQHFVPNFF